MEPYRDTDDSFLNKRKSKEPAIEYKSAHERCKSKVQKLLHSKAFHIAIVILCTLDGLLVIAMLMLEIETLKLAPGTLRSRTVLASFVLECLSLAIVSLFLLEIPLKVWVLGFSFYCKHWVELMDLTVCVVSFAVDVYNIQRHIEHEKHERKIQANASASNHPNPETEQQTMHDTIADVAGLLVLFRLWRVVRIVNAIVVTVTESHESQVENMKHAQQLAEGRIRRLERALWERGIPIPPPSKEEEELERRHRHHQSRKYHRDQRPERWNSLPERNWIERSRNTSVYENT